MMKNTLYISALVLLAFACTSETAKKEEDGHEHSQVATTPAKKYTCPMHAQVVQDKPGKCPVCGMDLVEMTNSEGASNSLMLSDSQVKLANITTQGVVTKPIGQTKAINARLATNEDRTEVISSRVSGRVEKLFVKETGRHVRQGDPLYEIYSEQLLTLEREFLLAKEQNEKLGTAEPRYASFLKAAKRKLILYGLNEKQIEQLAQTGEVKARITFMSPVSGVVENINVTEGQYVNEGSSLYRIENLNSLWVEADLYESELSLAKPGDKVTVRITGSESEPVDAKVIFLSPEYRNNSQITILRALMDNSKMNFKPGMQAQVLFMQSQRQAIAVPVDAFIRNSTGTHVYVQTDNNTFEPRMVKTAQEDFEQVEVTAGLVEGERVVVSGAYLLYSELVLKRGLDPMAGHNH